MTLDWNDPHTYSVLAAAANTLHFQATTQLSWLLISRPLSVRMYVTSSDPDDLVYPQGPACLQWNRWMGFSAVVILQPDTT